MHKDEEEKLQAIRHRNLGRLLRNRTQQQFSDEAGWPGASYVSRCIAGKKIGEKLARRAELRLGLAPGWFDREGDSVVAYKWPFSLTSLERVERLKPEQVAMLDLVLNAQITGFEQTEAPKKKPGGGGGTGGGGAARSGGGGGGTDVIGVPGGTTKHAPLTVVRMSAEEQRQAEEAAELRRQNPRAGRRRDAAAAIRAVKVAKNRDALEK